MSGSLLELLGLGVFNQSKSTQLPPLAINSEIGLLSRQSESYFKILKGATTDGSRLAVSPTKFDLSDQNHTQFLENCTRLFSDQSKRLKELDQKLALGLVTGMVATSLSFIPFVGYFSILGWGSALYYFNQRAQVYKDYQESMTLLVGCCNWSLGIAGNAREQSGLTKNPAIRNMMSALYPVLNEAQTRHLIDDAIEDIFDDERRAYEQGSTIKLVDKNIAQGKKAAQFQRCIYGFNKGSALDFIDAFLTLFPDMYRAIQDGFRTLQQRWSSPAARA